MTEHEHDESPTEIAEWLDVERASPGLSDGHRDAMWEKLEIAIGPGAGPPAHPDQTQNAGSQAPSRAAGTSSFAASALRMLPVVVVSALAGAAMHAFFTQDPPPPLASSVLATPGDARAPVAHQTLEYASATPEPSAPPTTTSAPTPTPTAVIPPVHLSEAVSAAPVPSVIPTVTVSDERALIERGRAALARRDWLSALEAIRERDKAYPQGGLREERDALEVQALALAGRNDDARTKAKAFLGRYPGSVFTLKIEALQRELGN